MGAMPRLLLVLLLALAAGNGSCADSRRPRIGGAINIFTRFGYLAISMKVVPRNDTEPWIFREPTLDIFRNPSGQRPSSQQRQPKGQTSSSVFNGDFHMEFCDNVRQLLQAYFRDFAIEKLEKPWSAFTASWNKAVIARHFGINASFVTGEHCYVLVRVARFRERQKLAGSAENLRVDDTVLGRTANVTVGDTASVVRFINDFGSHYIASYVTGNSLYQVFVYTPQVYLRIKERLKSRGIADLSSLELNNYFSPWYAEHMGAILSASGNRSVESWALDRLRMQYYIFSYASLLKLHGDASLLKQIDQLLADEALLQLQLRTLAPIFKDPKRRQWFLEVLDNHFKLYETNM